MYDLVVVGHGVAGLAAAVSFFFTAELVPAARIAVLERSPENTSGARLCDGAIGCR